MDARATRVTVIAGVHMITHQVTRKESVQKLDHFRRVSFVFFLFPAYSSAISRSLA